MAEEAVIAVAGKRLRLQPANATAERPARRLTLSETALLVIPAILTCAFIYISFQSGDTRAVDFHHEFWPAARRLLDGLSPYDRSWQHISGGVAFPYPALTALVFVPFAALPLSVADLVYTALSLGALFLTLRLLGVRDRRAYGVAVLWGPVVAAWQSANLTLLLGLGIAYLWRNRDRPLVAGIIVALLVSLKPFLWPLGLWLAVTRRWLALGYAAAAGAIVNVVAWGVVGFDQVGPYRKVVQAVTAVMSHKGYSLENLATRLGCGNTLAYLLATVAAAAVAAVCLKLGRREGGAPALTLCIVVALLASPVVWTHYFALLVVPLAIRRPRLSAVWLLPLLMWACPIPTATTAEILLAYAVVAVLVGSAFRLAPQPRRLRDVATATSA